MSFTGVDGLDASIDKANAWLAGSDVGFGTSDGRLACECCGRGCTACGTPCGARAAVR